MSSCALYNMDFWNQLSEDRPDLMKLSKTSACIHDSNNRINDLWKGLQKMNTVPASVMRLYGRYLCEVMDDQTTGSFVLVKAVRKEQEAHQNKVIVKLNQLGTES